MSDPRLIPREGKRREMKHLTAALDYLEQPWEIDRFLGRAKRAENGCLEMTGAASKEGYVQHTLSLGGFQVLVSAHKAAYFIEHGKWPSANHSVCHSCDNPICVEPSHLWLGDPRMNSHDMIRKGRWRSGRCVLNPSEVKFIRMARKFGLRVSDITTITGHTRRVVSAAARGETYAHIA